MSEHLGLSVGEALSAATTQGIPRWVAARLLAYALRLDKRGHAWLICHGSDLVPSDCLATYKGVCTRWLKDEPLEYILKTAEFFGLQLQVDARVLVPRPDTETLVDWALEVLNESQTPCVVDLGTGSGAIALALAHQRPDARLLAIDVSADALAVAHDNATRLKLAVEFAQGNWLEPLSARSTGAPVAWHLIVSNPPYIAEGDPHLGALSHEPSTALTSGSDGLNDIRHIVEKAPLHLTHEGWLLLEHGHDQALAVQTLMRQRGFEAVQSRNDLAGIARCTGGFWRRAPEAG